MFGGLAGTLPIQGTEYAARWDHLYTFLFWVCVVFFALVIIPAVAFAIRYRARPGVRADRSITHNLALEFTWTLIPTIVVIVIFAWGWIIYRDSVNVPPNAMEVRVIAKSWSWTFQYDDGRITTNELYVPINQPIKLTMTSEKNDVLHSFFVPNFRLKQDIVPGMFTTLWFQTDKPGQHVIFCAEYCGADHSNMVGKVVALTPEDFQKWRWGGEITQPPPVGLPVPNSRSQSDAQTKVKVPLTQLAKRGETLVSSLGCVACHTNDGSPRIGPSYHGLYGTERTLENGSKVLADDNYIREKIEFPQRKTVQGFPAAVMPSYAGQLNEADLNALIAYLKTLK